MSGSPQHKAINSIQLMFLLHTVPIGIGILGMVRFIADTAEHDTPLAVLLSGLYPQIGLIFMWLLLKRFKTLGIYEIHQAIFRKWIGGLLNLLFIGYCLFAYFMTLRTFVELVATWMFPMTPIWVLTLLFMIPVLYASFAGLQLLGRFAIMAFALTIWIFILNYFVVQEGSFTHLLPIGSTGAAKIFQGSLMASLSLLGFELLLVFYPYVTYKKDVLPASMIGIWSVILLYTITSVVTLMFFSGEQLAKTIWPMLTMFKHVQVPFIERFETIIIAMWLLQIVDTCSAYLWAGLEGVEKTLRLKKTTVYTVTAALTLILSQMVVGRTEINKYLDVLSKSGMLIMVAYPLVLWLISLVLRKKGEAT